MKSRSPSAGRSYLVSELVVWASFFFLIALSFSTSIQVQFTLPKLLWLRALSPLIVILWVVRFRRGEVRRLPMPILISTCALAAWWMFTTLFALDPVTAIQGMHGRYNGLLNHVIFLLIFLAVASTAASRREIEGLLTLFVAALVPVSIYAVIQNLGVDPMVWPNPRPGSTIGHPVPLAAILALAAPFALAFLATETSRLKRWMWSAILILSLVAIAATLSRGPWAGLVTALGVVLAAAVRHRIIEQKLRVKTTWIRGTDVAVTVVFLMMVLSLSWRPASVRRFTARVAALAHLQTDPSFMNRFMYFAAGTRMLLEHPLMGIGFENYGLLYPHFRPVEGEVVPSDELPTMVHNGYLQIAVSSGLPGVVMYLLLVGSIVLLLWRSYWRAAAPEAEPTFTRDRMIGAAFVGAIAGYLVQDLSGWPEISLSAFFWTLLGAAVSFCRSSVPRWCPSTGWRVAGSLSAVTVAIGIAALALATLREIRADGLFFETQFLDVSREWPRIEDNLATGLKLVSGDAYYQDVAGVLYLRRLRASGESRAYEQSAVLLERAALSNTFDPYILIHRIDLETMALQKRLVSRPSSGATRAVETLVEMDRNNATVHESVARLRLAEARGEEALTSIRRAEALRPHHPRYHMIEGDALRSLGDKPGAIEAYRTEAAILLPLADPDWVVAENKMILALAETGQYQATVAEALGVVARVPSNAVTHTLLGVAYLRLNAADMAKASFSRALAIEPANAGARQGLLEADRLLGQRNE